MNSLPSKSLVLINKYFKDELTAREEKEFDTAMESSEFRNEIYEQTVVLQSAVEYRRDELRSIIKNSHLEDREVISSTKAAKNKGSILFIVLSLLAAIAVTIGISVMKDNSVSNAEIFAEYYKPYTISEAQRGSTATETTVFEEIYYLYEDQKYDQVLSATNSMSSHIENVQLIQANSLLILGSFDESKTIFSKLTLSEDVKVKESSEWYLGLNHLKLGDRKEAIKIFLSIQSDTDHNYNRLALKVLADLKQE